MHLRLTIIFLSFMFIVCAGQNFGTRQRNPMFTSRRCPPQLDRTIFKCVQQSLIEVPHYIHSQTQVLDLSGNRLTILHESNFANLLRLTRLVLDDNKIWKITQNTFLTLNRLTELSLRSNHLSIDISNSITARILAPLVSLQRLDLSYNPLQIIPDGLFANSSTINCLILDSVGNPLRLTSKAFVDLPKLELLSLEENQLSTLPENIFQRQTKLDLTNVRLSKNPWNCNCSMKWLRVAFEKVSQSNQINHLVNSNLIFHRNDNPSCSFPLQWKGFPLSQVPPERFQCKIEVVIHQANVTASTGSDVSLMCRFNFVNNENSTITWYHNNRRIIPALKIFQYDDNGPNRTSMINISSVGFRDAGIYHCQIVTRHDSVKKNIYLAIFKSPDESLISGIRVIFTIGTILASLIIIIVSILAIIYLIKHRSIFCLENSKLDSVFHCKVHGRDQDDPDNNNAPMNSSQIHNNTQSEAALTLLKCSGSEYLSIHRPHQTYSSPPFMYLPKPAFQCTHNRPVMISRNPNLSRDYSYDESSTAEICESCLPSETCTTLDSYSKCPLHGHRNLHSDSLLSEPANSLVNINCPLHGCKSENLFYYELSNN